MEEQGIESKQSGVNGFAARYYLNRLDYQKATQYANATLAEYNTLVDYNTEMRYGIPETLTLNSGTPQQSSYTIQYLTLITTSWILPTCLGGMNFFISHVK